MAATPLNLHKQFSISFSSFTSLYALHFKNPEFFTILKPPQNPNFITPKVPLKKVLGKLPSALGYPGPESEPKTHLSSPPLEERRSTQEATEAVREYLLEVGASSEDASLISLNCPNYLKMLIDGVNDLDDWNSWSQEKTGNTLDFKKKVYQLAEQKGDKGVIPFLESIGLSLPSATHLARYFSSSSESNALPLLVLKVRYVKEIFFSGSDDDDGVIGKNALRMMAHLSISMDDDVQQTLAFFEKIQARRGGLNLLGSEQASFRYLIESFPRLLFLPLESRAKPILNFLEDIGVPKGYIRNVLLLFPPILFYDLDKQIKPRLRLYEKVITRDNDLGKMLAKYPWILSTSILENTEKVIDFFDEEKVPKISSSNAIKNWPHILGCSIDKLKLMVDQFFEMGVTNKKLGKVIAKSPQLLLRKPQEFIQVVSFFKDLGLDNEAIAKTLCRCPEIFAANIDKTLKKKLEFLSCVGISKTHIPRVIRKYPELFVCDVDRALFPRVRYLKKVGLSKKDIGFMVRRFSPLLGYSIEQVLRPKLDFLVNTMDRPLRDVVDYPRYFSYSLEKKIKPRYWVLKSRNMEIKLNEMLGKNDEEFAADYLGVDDILVPPT
ncbi:hypothetical protein ACJIZ3_020949 [Penstemon smallii]|uniref:Uncharacterized protein n=1 Tax=Penstemon smallii TaxID=265156 RepID=A0ABD3SKN3_9LAMI